MISLTSFFYLQLQRILTKTSSHALGPKKPTLGQLESRVIPFPPKRK